MSQAIEKRFVELVEQLATLEATRRTIHSEYVGTYEEVDEEQFLNWRAKVRSLISNAFGDDSSYFKALVEAEKPVIMSTKLDFLKKIKAVFLTAREDFESGLTLARADEINESNITAILPESSQAEFRLPPPEKLTPRWLLDNVPFHYWLAYFIFLVSAFVLGVQASRLSWVCEIFGLKK